MRGGAPHTDEIQAVLEVILETGPEIELHFFGVKHGGLAIYGEAGEIGACKKV